MNRILPTIVAFLSFELNKCKEIVFSFWKVYNQESLSDKVRYKSKGLSKSFAFLLLLLFAISFANAATIHITANTLWSNINPNSTDIIIVRNGATLTIDVTNATCASLQLGKIGGGSSAETGALTFAKTGSPSLIVTGAVVIGGDTSATLGSTGTITFTNGSSLSAGSLQLGGIGSNNTGAMKMTAGGTLIIGGPITVGASAGTWDPGIGTVVMTANNTLPSANPIIFNNLTISSGTTTAGASFEVGGVLSIASSATLNMSTYAMTAGSSFTTSGSGILRTQNSSILPLPIGKTWSGIVQYDGAAQTVSAGTYGSIVLAGSNTKTFANTTTINNNLSVATGVKANLGAFQSTATALTLGGTVKGTETSYGGTSSPAVNILPTYFATNTGYLNVACGNYSISSIAAATSVCIGSTATITVTSTALNLPNGTYTVFYTLGAPNAGTGSASMSVSGGTGTFTTSVLNNNGSIGITINNIKTTTGCVLKPSTGNTATITVNPLLVDKTVAAVLSTVCYNTGTTITVELSETGVNYQLRDNSTNALVGSAVSGMGGTIDLPTGNLTATTTFNVLASLAGCPQQMSVTPTITVSQLSNVGLTVSSPRTVCLGTSVPFTATPSNEGVAPTYEWTKNGITISGANSSVYTGVAGTDFVNNDVIGCVLTSTATCVSQATATAATSPIIVTTIVIPTLSNIEIDCSATSFELASLTAVPGITDYLIDVNEDSNFSAAGSILNGFSLGNISPETTAVSGLNKAGTYKDGTYYVRVRAVTAGCGTITSSTLTVSVKSTSYNGTSWTPVDPNANSKAIFAASTTISTSIDVCSCVINPGVSVTIPSDKVLTITNALTNNGGTITFENNASLVQTNNTPGINTGSIIYKRISQLMNNLDYTYWSSPVSGQTLKALVPNTDKYYRLGTTDWISAPSATVMGPPGRGYIIRVPKQGVYGGLYPETVTFPYSEPVQFVGVPNNGHYDLPINVAGLYNLIGNPYPSALSADAFLTANATQLEGTIYFWTHNTAISSTGYVEADYASYNFTGGVAIKNPAINSGGNNNAPTGNIAAGQSFLAMSKGTTTGSVIFDNDMRVVMPGNNKDFFRGTKSKTTAIEKHRVWLNLTNTGGAFKQMLIGYISGATNSYDSGFDGESLDGNTFIDFYSINEDKNLVIQGRVLPFDENDQIPLGYRTTIAGTFQISIDHADGILVNQPIFVEDKLINAIHNLKNGSYSFTTAKGTFNDRFVLRYSDKTAVGSSLGNTDFDEKQKGLVVSVKNHKIKINSFDEIMNNIMVYDLKGSLLYENKQLNYNEFSIPNFNSSDQFLIVRIQLSSGKWVTKEIVFY